MRNIYDCTLRELEDYFVSIGDKKFRATQIYDFLYKKRVNNVSDMKNIGKNIQKHLEENFSFEILEFCEEQFLREKEIYWINKLDAINRGYNELNNWQPEIATQGESHPNHKLTEQDVIDIRIRYNNKERCKEVEELYKYKIGHSGFSKVWKGETWKHIMPEVYTEENKKYYITKDNQNIEVNNIAEISFSEGDYNTDNLIRIKELGFVVRVLFLCVSVSIEKTC